jgi:fructan beta-fructosidase
MLNKITFFFLVLLIFACKTTQNTTTTMPQEQHRPNFHFTPPSQWMNDPNGMVFYEGEYHLFYQYYPSATVWGPMHWGHAVSKNMVNWEHLPIAIYPDSLGLIFSGSAVVDWKNTSGFGQGGKPPLVAIFTQHDMVGEKAGRSDFQYQSIAYSNDKGRTWTKYKGNPVIPNVNKIRDFRDPKMLWDEAHQQWTMVFAAQNHIKIWASKDLKTWTHQSDFGATYGTHAGVWECPDLFPINIEGTKEQKWVLLQSLNPGAPNGGSGTQYFVGDFDGKTFTLDTDFAKNVSNGQAAWLDWGRDNYAGVTWSDIPKTDGRRLFMGWMSNWDYAQNVPTKSWRSATTLPRQLILSKTAQGLHLLSQPVKELEKLRKNTYTIENQTISDKLDITKKIKFSPSSMEMSIAFELEDQSNTDFSIVLSNSKGEQYEVGYNATQNQFYSDRTKAGKVDFSDKFAKKVTFAPRSSTDKTIKLHLFFDTASCELFADNGATVLTDIFFPNEDFTTIKLVAKNGKVMLRAGKIDELVR